jgi:hypothetical protein
MTGKMVSVSILGSGSSADPPLLTDSLRASFAESENLQQFLPEAAGRRRRRRPRPRAEATLPATVAARHHFALGVGSHRPAVGGRMVRRRRREWRHVFGAARVRDCLTPARAAGWSERRDRKAGW